jgi:hypothetical protein
MSAQRRKFCLRNSLTLPSGYRLPSPLLPLSQVFQHARDNFEVSRRSATTRPVQEYRREIPRAPEKEKEIFYPMNTGRKDEKGGAAI